jgi:hypothetical protein
MFNIKMIKVKYKYQIIVAFEDCVPTLNGERGHCHVPQFDAVGT